MNEEVKKYLDAQGVGEVWELVFSLVKLVTGDPAGKGALQQQINGLEARIAAVASATDAYSTTKSYKAGDYVMLDGVLYRFVADKAAGAWDASKVTRTSFVEEIGGLSTVMGAATASVAGKAGMVPTPPAGAQGKYLKGDGTWGTPPNTWRGIQDNLTSTSTSDSLSAAQGKVLKGLIDQQNDNFASFEKTKGDIVSSALGNVLGLTSSSTWAQMVTAITGVANKGQYSKWFTPGNSAQSVSLPAGYYIGGTIGCYAQSGSSSTVKQPSIVESLGTSTKTWTSSQYWSFIVIFISGSTQGTNACTSTKSYSWYTTVSEFSNKHVFGYSGVSSGTSIKVSFSGYAYIFCWA